MNRRTWLTGAVLGALVLAGGCRRQAPAQPPPKPSAATPRIVALSPAVAATLRDIDLGGLIVGRHGSDKWSDQGLPACGDQVGIDYEALMRVGPTDVLLQRPDIEARLQELGARRAWTVVNYRILSLDDILSTTRDLWTRFGNSAPRPEAPGEPAFVRMDREMGRAWSARIGIDAGNVGRVLLLSSVSPPAALGPGSFHQQILERLGAKPAITEGAAYVTMDLEDVLRRRPDAIVLFAPREPAAPARPWELAEIRELLGPLARLEIPANRSGHVAVIDHPMANVPCPSAMVEVADELARILEGWSQGPLAP